MGSADIDTKWIRLDMHRPIPEQIMEWGIAIREGDLIAFPTETVYGLGANGLDEKAVRKIYVAKGRPSDNPLILHVNGMSMVRSLVQSISPLEYDLMSAFWPGPLTLIFPKSDIVPDIITGGGRTVAIRCPGHPVAQALITAAGVPIAAPSANLSGRPSPCAAASVFRDLAGKIKAVIDGGPCVIGLESTVVTCDTDGIVIYRPGAVTLEMLQSFAPAKLDDALCSGRGIPKAPGMKYRHYAPNIPVHVRTGSQSSLISYFSAKYASDLGFFVSTEIASALPDSENIWVWGNRAEPERLAADLYEGLLYLETRPIREIYVEGISEEGIGMAVMNRLKKASGYDVQEVTE